MGNYTSVPTVFHILPFSDKTDSTAYVFSFLTIIYLLGVFLNVMIVTLVFWDKRLHSPMYLFLCNLSFVDLCFTTTIIPKLLHIMSSGNHNVSFGQCFTQVYFFLLAGLSEDLLLFTMAYDRYVAICRPLHYHSLMSRKVCAVCVVSIWCYAAVNSCLVTVLTMKMSFCHSTTIHHFSCDAKALTRISCAGKELLYLVIYIEAFIIGFGPFLCSFWSYAKILQVISYKI
ncbi:hypothetical protein GDO81_023884 [Engystomops pustulosus]|uniref:G-protein coupled receptors family 1 profile domain-containing protein n=1 Tax=Engystomops pustulosus TaxID=76066 RepID=A0AAV6ZUD3_ENGPU|nr:hypothetical protein GDO81_023884 [Engystomops pustulosus]